LFRALPILATAIGFGLAETPGVRHGRSDEAGQSDEHRRSSATREMTP
jgi:hypothetical protein